MACATGLPIFYSTKLRRRFLDLHQFTEYLIRISRQIAIDTHLRESIEA
jgi:hypothetical protein